MDVLLGPEPGLLTFISRAPGAGSGVLEAIKSHAPWLIVAAAIVVAVFQNAIKQWLTAAVNGIGRAVYGRLSASRALRRVAVRKYLESLRRKYVTLNVLFRPNNPLNLEEIYVPLEFLSTSKDRSAEEVDMEKLISARRRVVVLGAPGAGKSVLLRHIAVQHANPQGRRAPGFMPVLLDLHRLTAADDADGALQKQLADYFARNDFPKAKRFVQLSLKNGNLLLLFDGLDEVPSAQRAEIAAMIDDFLEFYPRCPAIVTCRSAAFRDYYIKQASVRLMVADFTDQLIQQFLSRWPGISGPQAVNECVRILNDSPRMLALVRNPLLLTMLAYLYTDVYGESSRLLPRSRADFYRDATDVLLRRWHEERNRFDPNSKREVLRRLSLVGLDRGRGTSDRLALEYELVQSETKDVLHDVGRNSKDAEPLLKEIIERSGLLLEIDGGERYQFAHLTLQEYFAAAELAASQDDLLERYDRDHDTWRETVRLWCGSAGDCTSVVERVFAIEPILALECIADASRIDQSTVDKVVGHFARRSQLSADDRVTRALSEVASHSEARGGRLLAALEGDLASSGEVQAAAARILAATHSERSARLLLTALGGTPEFRVLVARMGDVAVTPLAESMNQGDPQAVEFLGDIGTPRAAVALTDALWSQDAVATAAAWRLAQLLSDPLIDEALAEYALPEDAKSQPWINWIWAPFTDDGKAPIRTIAGRIAYLIEKSSVMPGRTYRLDPRIVLPLLLVHDSELSMKIRTKFKRTAALMGSLRPLAGTPDFSFRRLYDQGNNIDAIDISMVLDRVKVDSIPGDRLADLVNEVASQAHLSQVQRYLLNALPTRQEFFAIRLGLHGPYLAKQWEGTLDEIAYDQDHSWHFRVTQFIYALLIIAATMSGILLLRYDHAMWQQVLLGLALASLVAGISISIMLRDEFGFSCAACFLSPLMSIVTAADLFDGDAEDWLMVASFGATPSLILLTSFALSDHAHLAWWNIAIAWLVVTAIIIGLIAHSSSLQARVRNPLRGITKLRQL